MAPSSNNSFGWELLYNAVKNELNDKKNLGVVLIHFALLKSNFRCIGTGDKKDETGPGSELLPEGWTAGDNFILSYIRDNLVYTLRSTAADKNNLIFNLVQLNTKKVSNVVIDLDTIKDLDTPVLNSAKKIFNEVYETIKNELINHILETETKNADTQTKTKSSLIEPPTSPQPNSSRDMQTQRHSIDRESHLRVGRRDLDPFAPPDGGGMIFDPFNDARQRGPDFLGIPGPPLPRGAVPPGARFDPFGPPDNAIGPRRRFPDPDDHFYT